MQFCYTHCALLQTAMILLCLPAFGQSIQKTTQFIAVEESTMPADDVTPRQAAERGLSSLADRSSSVLSADNASRILAVTRNADLQPATIGFGFQVNLIDPQAILAGNSLAASASPSGEWRFVVMLNNQPVGLITVVQVSGRWKMVAVGASELARDVMIVVSRYSNASPQTQLRFLRSQQGIADFIEVRTLSADTGATPLYIPLSNLRDQRSRPSIDKQRNDVVLHPLPDSDILPILKTSVRRGLRFPGHIQ